jgi:hypothetical protein
VGCCWPQVTLARRKNEIKRTIRSRMVDLLLFLFCMNPEAE